MSVTIAYIRNNLELIQDLILLDLEDNPYYVKLVRSLSQDDDDDTLFDVILCTPIVTLNDFSFEIIENAGGSGDNYFCCRLEDEFSPAETSSFFKIPHSPEYHPLRELAQSFGALTQDATLSFFCNLN